MKIPSARPVDVSTLSEAEFNEELEIRFKQSFFYDEINALIREKKTNVKKVVAEVSKRLKKEYGSGFDKMSISRMIKFYQEFPDFEKVATLSQQLTWSHLVEILPIQDELKRDFYVAMCMQENWS